MSAQLNPAIYSVLHIKSIEEIAISEYNLSETDLMEKAGLAAFEYLLKKFPQATSLLFFCGGGNNGGDGYVLARLCHEKGFNVTIVKVREINPTKVALLTAYKKISLLNVKHITPAEWIESESLETDLIIDAICGIGLTAQINPEMSSLIEKINASQKPVFSLDIPTGINADTGEILGTAIFATATLTFIGYKLGLLTGEGKSYCGEVSVNDLNISEAVFNRVNPIASILALPPLLTFLKPRLQNWHKGLSGHVLILGGNLGFAGAPRMAAEAALRVGAGLVTIGTRPEHAPYLNNDRPEIMVHGVQKSSEIDALIALASVIVLGPGLGKDDWAQRVFHQAIKTDLPLIVDADGLNLLSQHPIHRDNWILTPHPGEAARLLNEITKTIQADRLAAIQKIVRRYGGTAVLKGAGSLILHAKDKPYVCTAGNPGMSTAGMGDVLSGVIGGLAAQSIRLPVAAQLGVLLHSLAGDLAKVDGERGMLALDLMPYLRKLANSNEE